MGIRKTINIERLIADEENPRFEAVSTEEDALFSILEDQAVSSGNKLLNLARDIAANGLNEFESLVVSPIDGTDNYRVREGNRRVTAIKLSLHSDQVPEHFSSLAPHFAELYEQMQAHRLIDCYVCDDESEIRRLLILRHGGESGGVGTVKWNSTQTARFSQEGNQQTARALSLIEHFQEKYGRGELWRSAASIPATNLGRLISTPKVRLLLNIIVDGNDARYLGGHDDLLFDVFRQVRDGGVGPIYSKDDRVRLVEDAVRRIESDGPKQEQLLLSGTEKESDATSESSDGWTSNGQSNDSAFTPSEGYDADVNQRTNADTGWESSVFGTLSDGADTVIPSNNPSQQGDYKKADDQGVGTTRRKPVSRNADKRMFGCVLRPKGVRSNDLYRAIDWVDLQYLSSPNKYGCLLPILGFSLRLLVETVAREYYEAHGKSDVPNIFNSFMKDVAKPAIKNKISISNKNYIALASEWIDGDVPLDALFHKWAHGVIPVERASLVRQSELVALIIQEVWSDGGGRQ